MSLYGASFTSLSNIVFMKSLKGKRKAITSSDQYGQFGVDIQRKSFSDGTLVSKLMSLAC